jgi:lysophospholipase L1-like esterase
VKRFVLKIGAVLLFALLGLAAMEIVALWMGLGTPVLYYTSAWGGLRPLPDQKVVRLGGATLTVDENGFRTAREHEPGAMRVLYIGDSVTWGGSYIDDSELFSEVSADVLRANHLAVYAMNAGVNGTSLVNHAEIFRRHAEMTDVLVWLFPAGDATRAYRTGGIIYPPRFAPRFALVEVIDLAIYLHWSTIFRLDLPPPGAWTSYPGRYHDLFVLERSVRMTKNLGAMRCVLEWAIAHEIPVVLGVTPVLNGDNRVVPPPIDVIAQIKEIESDSINLFDVYETINNHEDDFSKLFVDDVHFSAKGHRIVGEALGKQLLVVAREHKIRSTSDDELPIADANPDFDWCAPNRWR